MMLVDIIGCLSISENCNRSRDTALSRFVDVGLTSGLGFTETDLS